jgi:23S rRNA (guanosine2251-2'-O)-methyltransferase
MAAKNRDHIGPKSRARLIVSRPSRRNDRDPRRPAHFHARHAPRPEGGLEWLWGRHAVQAALANPRREHFGRLVLAPGRTLPADRAPKPETLDNREIARLLPPGAVHQGFALLAAPAETADLEDIAWPAEGVILILDQVTDPQNVGAILRSAAAFGARGVVIQDRHAPPLSGALAKAAAGAADVTPIVRTTNLSRALEKLAELGWRSVGLDSHAQGFLHEVLDGGPTVLVLGSEGEGLRRLVAEHCDSTARIAMAEAFESLNVASAAAVALYQARQLARPVNPIT